jgi:mono/diheme cytochrome c family protein
MNLPRLGFAFFALSVVAFGSLACSSASPRTTTISALKGDAVAGKTVFTTNCVSCHGTDAKSGSAGKNLPAESADDAYGQIVEGGGGMPAFGTLSDQDVANVWAYVQTLK